MDTGTASRLRGGERLILRRGRCGLWKNKCSLPQFLNHGYITPQCNAAQKSRWPVRTTSEGKGPCLGFEEEGALWSSRSFVLLLTHLCLTPSPVYGHLGFEESSSSFAFGVRVRMCVCVLLPLKLSADQSSRP